MLAQKLDGNSSWHLVYAHRRMDTPLVLPWQRGHILERGSLVLTAMSSQLGGQSLSTVIASKRNGGIVFISLYLHDGEGLSQRNKTILQIVGALVRDLRVPWAIGGDFNFAPDVLAASMW